MNPSDLALGYTVSVQITASPKILLQDQPLVRLLHPDGAATHYSNSAKSMACFDPYHPLRCSWTCQVQIHGFAEEPILPLLLQPREFPVQSIRLPAGASVWAIEVEWAKVGAFRQHISPEKY